MLCLICGNVILGPGVIAVRLRSLILIPCVGSAVHNSAVIADCIRCRIALSQFRAWCGASPVTVPRSSDIPRSLAKLGHDLTANPIPRQLAVGVEA